MPLSDQKQPLRHLTLAAGATLLLVPLWAMMATGDGASSASPSPFAAAALSLVFLATFSALAFNVVGRLAAVAAGAFATLVLGILLKFYFPPAAVFYLGGKSDTLALLAGISVITGVLQESGLFERLALRVVRVSRGSPWRLMARLCLLTFACSLLMNNLATILVIIPLSLRVAKATDMDPVPLVVGEIIASNLGGASTMIGDFPNMLIATETGLPFHEFLFVLAPICFVQLIILILFLSPRFDNKPMEPGRLRELLQGMGATRWSRSTAVRGLCILGVVVVGLVAGGWFGVPVAGVAAGGALLAFLFGRVPWRTLIRRMCVDEILFFGCLFLMVGALAGTGILDHLGSEIGSLWRRNPAAAAIALAWAAALLTCFINAGPTTALLIPMVLSDVSGVAPGGMVWWAVSLGVCAGSSATLTGATAGPVAAGLLEKRGYSLTFGEFAKLGVPLMLIFLVTSSVYLALIG